MSEGAAVHEVRLTIPAKPEYITLCRLALTGISRFRELSEETLSDLKLAITEACSNSVRHARLDEADAIQVRVRGSNSMLHVDVVDPGPGFDPQRLPSARPNGGWGLRLLDRLATRWGVDRNDVTRVWFELTSPVSSASLSGN